MEETDPEDADPEIESSKDSEAESEDTSRIKFSRDKDLQRYKASRVRRKNSDNKDTDYRNTDFRNADDSETDRDRGHRNTEYRDMEYRAAEFGDSGGERQIENGSSNASGYGLPDSTEGNVATEVAEEENGELKQRLLNFTSDKSALLAVPAAMFIALVALLVLTFYSESIPEFTGALASAMLIVTLIIYGAATLLKA